MSFGPPPAAPDPERARSGSGGSPTMLDDEVRDALGHDESTPSGAAIGRYVILERIGAGGMGVVYAAWDPELSRRVALKVLHGSDLAHPNGDQGQARLLREAQALARLTHPNVVTVHDVGTVASRVFVAMEYVEGKTLGAWLQAEPREWRTIVEMSSAAGRGLAAAHEQGLVHRDFKPDNVLVGDDGRPRVLDFGLARATGDTSLELDVSPDADVVPEASALEVRLTATGAFAGTPAYMAPEQHNRLPPDARSDQFSFCVTLWEALYGQRPFVGESRVMLAMNVCRGVMREPPAGARVPIFVRRVLERGLSTDPGARFGSMQALLEALSADPRSRRRRWWLGAVGGIAVLGGIAAAALRPAAVVDPCGAGAARAAESWNDEVRADVRAGILGVQASFAEPAWTTVESGLDAYVGAWASAHRDACEATAVRHEQSEDLLDRRMTCLRERIESVDAMIRVLAAADREVVVKAAEAMSDLPRLEPCADTATLMARVAPPADARVRESVDVLRRRLTELRATLWAGKYREGWDAVRELRREAEALGYEPLLAEARLAEGNFAHAVGDDEAAETALDEAAFVALAVGHDEVLARAATKLVSVVGVSRSRYDAGEVWGRQAEAAVRRIGERSELAADHANAMCFLLADQGASTRAMPWCERSRSIAEELWGPDDLNTGQAHRALGNAHYAAGDYARAEEAYERAWQILEAVEGPDHPNAAILLNSIAAVCYSRGGKDRCVPLFADTLAAAERGLGSEHPAVADFANNLAIVLHAVGRSDEAEHHARRSLAIRMRGGAEHPGIGAAHVTLGTLAMAKGDHAAALVHYDRAVDNLVTTRGERHHDVVNARANRAEARVALQQVAGAVTDFERALAVAAELQRPSDEITQMRLRFARALMEHAPRERRRAMELANAALRAGVSDPGVRAELEALAAGEALPP